MTNKEFPQQPNMPYPYPMPYQDNDEIDLIELFRTLWKQKAKIALVTAATTLAAGIYAFTAEEVWTSKAVFDTPKLEDINEYYNVTQQLKRILQKPTMGEVALEPKKITQDVYSEFIKQIDSGDLRKEFWHTSDYYAEKIKNEKTDIDKLNVLNSLLEDNIKVEVADGKKIIYPTVMLSADSASTAKKLLEQYIDLINKSVWQEKLTELNTVISQEITDLESEKKRIIFNAETQKNNDIKLSENAKNIAEKANIKDFNINAMQGNANVGKTGMLFFLGTKALDAQINNLTNKPLILPLRYYQIEKILSEIKSFSSIKDINVKGYRYLMSPSEPVKKDKPNKALIISVGLMFGIIIGVICVILRFVIVHQENGF